jgi:hypothetical protein
MHESPAATADPLTRGVFCVFREERYGNQPEKNLDVGTRGPHPGRNAKTVRGADASSVSLTATWKGRLVAASGASLGPHAAALGEGARTPHRPPSIFKQNVALTNPAICSRTVPFRVERGL